MSEQKRKLAAIVFTDIVDFTISKKLEGYLFSLNIDNLLNENYQRPHGYPQNRRQLRIGFRKIF